MSPVTHRLCARLLGLGLGPRPRSDGAAPFVDFSFLPRLKVGVCPSLGLGAPLALPHPGDPPDALGPRIEGKHPRRAAAPVLAWWIPPLRPLAQHDDPLPDPSADPSQPRPPPRSKLLPRTAPHASLLLSPRPSSPADLDPLRKLIHHRAVDRFPRTASDGRLPAVPLDPPASLASGAAGLPVLAHSSPSRPQVRPTGRLDGLRRNLLGLAPQRFGPGLARPVAPSQAAHFAHKLRRSAERQLRTHSPEPSLAPRATLPRAASERLPGR